MSIKKKTFVLLVFKENFIKPLFIQFYESRMKRELRNSKGSKINNNTK